MTEQGSEQGAIRDLADLIDQADRDWAHTPMSKGGPRSWCSMGRRRAEAIAVTLLREGYRK